MSREHADRVLAEVDRLAPEQIEALADALEGSVLEPLGQVFKMGAAFHRHYGRPHRGRVARLRMAGALWQIARGPDGEAIAHELRQSGDDFWLLVADALDADRTATFFENDLPDPRRVSIDGDRI